MSLGNEFSYNDYSDVKTVPIIEYNQVCVIDSVAIYKHKSKAELYCCMATKIKGVYYADSEYWKRRFQKDFPSVRAYYIRGKIFFQNATVKSIVENFIFT